MATPGSRSWSFIGPVAESAIDLKASEPRRLLDALRAGVGLGVRFRLEWTSGPVAAVRLVTDDALSVRWIERLLLPSYGAGRWRGTPTDAPRSGSAFDERFGALRGEPGSSLPHADPAPWTEAVLNLLPGLERGLVVAWQFRGLGLGPWKAPPSRPTEPEPIPSGWRARPLTSPERLERDRREARRRSPAWAVRLTLRSPSSATGRSARRPLEGMIEAASARDGDARLHFLSPRWPLRSRPPEMYLGEPEVAGILPARTTRFATPPAPASPISSVLPIGLDSTGIPIGLSIEPSEGRHLAVVGETGMGKSTLLVRLALSAVPMGTVVLFDPIGDTGRRFIEQLPPVHRSRVVWISPAESPVAIDLLDPLRAGAGGEVGADRALSALVDALRRVRAARYADSPFWGPRIEETLRITLATAAAIPGTTIADAERILAGSLGRAAPVAPEARDAYESLRERVRDRPEEVDGSRRLLREITQRPALVRMLTARSSHLRFRDLSSPGHIYVITGDASTVGEAASRYLLAVYLALFWSERLSIPGPSKTFLVLDEAQWYAHDSISEMLRLGRRSNLHVWLATQALASLPDGVHESVGTNVADLVVFRGSPDEARELARMTPALTPEMLWGLPRGTAAVLLGKGERVSFLEVSSLPSRGSGGGDALAAVAASSRRYWPDLPYENEGGRPSIPPAPPDPGAASPGVEPPLREVLLVLWAGLLHDPGTSTIRVHLADLRRVSDPAGGAVRSVGRVLGDAGVLEVADRDAQGTYWQVRREGFSRLLGGSVAPEELSEANRQWHRLTNEGTESAQPS